MNSMRAKIVVAALATQAVKTFILSRVAKLFRDRLGL